MLGAAVMDDIMGVVLLALHCEFAIGGGVSLADVSKVILFVGLIFAELGRTGAFSDRWPMPDLSFKSLI
jgi:Kef-type K+ transport system membrane component KefB